METLVGSLVLTRDNYRTKKSLDAFRWLIAECGHWYRPGSSPMPCSRCEANAEDFDRHGDLVGWQ